MSSGVPTVIAGLAALFAAAPASALDTTARLGPVEARVTIEPEAPVIGDPIQLVIEAIADEGVEVLMPEFGDALDRFQIVDFVPREGIDDQGRTVSTQRYTLRAPKSGPHTLPSLLIEFVDRRPGMDPAPEGQDAYELLTDPLPFAVESLVVDAAAADLAPPLGRLDPLGGRGGPPWPWIVAGLASLAVAMPFAWRAWRRRSDRSRQQSAYEVARRQLDALQARALPGPEEVDAFFVSLSSIVRHYLEDRFALRSPELTTERFIESVSGSPDLRAAHQEMLRAFLRQADLVKFAHHIPPREAIEESLSSAIQFVEETRDPGESTTGGPLREQAAGA